MPEAEESAARIKGYRGKPSLNGIIDSMTLSFQNETRILLQTRKTAENNYL